MKKNKDKKQPKARNVIAVAAITRSGITLARAPKARMGT